MQNQKHLFSLDPEHTYLNCAYMSPQLKSVEEIGIQALKRKSQPHSITGDDFFNDTEELRVLYSQLIGASNPKRSVIIPSVSYGMANVAMNLDLKAGQNIVVAGEQFPSNVYPWMTECEKADAELRIIEAPFTHENRAELWNEHILSAIDEDTKMVAIGHIHWADGTLFDLKAIRKKTREYDAWLVIDGTQSIGALPFDVEEFQPDALVCSGYKWMMGPYSIGMAYYGEVFDDGMPIEQNWINRHKSEDFAGLVNYQHEYQPGALRYEVGEHSNFVLVPMLMTAIKQLLDWGIENIQSYCKDLVEADLAQLKADGFIIEDETFRSSHLFGIRIPNELSMDELKKQISDQNILVSYRGDCIRVAPHVYNTQEEFSALTKCLQQALATQ